MRESEETTHAISAMPVTSGWHIPRPSLSGSSGGGSAAGSDQRTRGGSSSSQGSASNHSTHSVSSGSLLLSAAHLARVHGARNTIEEDEGEESRSVYSANLTSYVANVGNHRETVYQHRKLHRTDATVEVSIPEEAADPFWSGVKRGSAPDQDSGSVASSTHFTVVNGFTRHRGAKPETTPWCCNSSHQVTVLVITMTILFSACILAAICFVEMRLRKDSDYRFS